MDHTPVRIDRSDPDATTGHPGATTPRCRHGHRLSRRAVLGGAAGVAAASVAGCLGDGGGTAPDAVEITDGVQCDVCGMIIANHHGPNGQLFHESNTPTGHDNPALFDSLSSCFFPYYFERQRRDWTVASMYATDYSTVDYDLVTEGDTTYISSHTAPESFAPARDLHYVVGSDVVGAMGPDFLPFSRAEDASEFADEHGGSVARFDDIDETLVGSNG
jgi:copper chaperone NosL